MNAKLISILTTLTSLALISAKLPAQAVVPPSSVGFNFTTDFSGNDPQGDIWLNGIQYGDKNLNYEDLALVKTVSILQNTATNAKPGDTVGNNNTGAASTDRGDKASGPMATSGVKNPTGGEIAAFLGNRNLNNIVDTEDAGSFQMKLTFSQAVRNVFLWERGMNSTLRIQGLIGNEAVGNLLVLNSRNWGYAGYKIDTTEIVGAQNVGSVGISLDDLGLSQFITGLIISTDGKKGDNGPDFKVAGEAVPEPFTMTGLALGVGGLMAARRRKMLNNN
jgi:hypothetical protein